MSISQISGEGLVTLNVGKLSDQFRVIQSVLSGHDTAITTMKSSKDEIEEVKRTCARLADDVMKSKAVVSQFEKMGADLKKFNSVQKDLEASQKIFEHKLLAVSAESEETGKSVSEVKEEVQQVRSDITKISSFNLDVSPTELEDFGVQKTPISNVDFFLSQLMIIFLTTNKLKSFAKDLQIALVDVDRNTHATKTMVEEASSHIVNLRSNVESLQREQHELMEQHQELKAIVESTSKDFAKHREMSDQKLGHFTEYVSGEFKEVESKIESLRGTCSNESVVRHLVSALEKTNAEFKAQQDFHKIFVENTRAEMLALHSKVEGLLKEKHSDKPPVQNFTTTIATMPSELDAMRFGIEQTRKEMTNMAVKQRRVEDLLGQKADLSYTNSLVRQIVGDFTAKTQSHEVKEQENTNLIRQALSKLHESVKDKVNRSELKLLRETLEKTRNMEIKSLDPKHSKAGDDSSLGDLFDRPDLEHQLRGIFTPDGSKRSSRPKSAIGYNTKFDRQSEADSRQVDYSLCGDSGSQPGTLESLVLVETPLMGKDGRQYIGAPRPLTQLSSKSMSNPLLLSPELPVRFAGNINGKGANTPKRATAAADNLPVVTGKSPVISIASIPTVPQGAAAGR